MKRKYNNTRNPILPVDIHIPDCEAHIMPDGKLYLYGSYDDREDVFCSEKYHVVSTEDLQEWTIHEEALNGKNVPWFENPEAPKYPGIDWSNPTPFVQKMMERDAENGVDMKKKFEEQEKKEKMPLLFAPDCIHKNGKYYLYFCMQDDSEGVAVSDTPEGPFANPVQLPCGGIDPAIFTDDNGETYYYWGQLFSHGVKLEEDMMSFKEEQVENNLVTEQEHFFHEGSSMRKIGNTYYYVYADMERGKPTSLGYATGNSPLGPFTYRGIIIDNAECDPASWNNHGSIECVKGQWYVFYHRSSRGTQRYRRLCAEKIEILEDGTIPEVKMTSQGVGKPFESGETIYGYQACGLGGTVYIDKDGEDSECLDHISDGDTAVFRYVKSLKGFRKAAVNSEGTGKVQIFLDGVLTGEGVVSAQGIVEIPLMVRQCVKEQELMLKFLNPSNLKIRSVTLLS